MLPDLARKKNANKNKPIINRVVPIPMLVSEILPIPQTIMAWYWRVLEPTFRSDTMFLHETYSYAR